MVELCRGRNRCVRSSSSDGVCGGCMVADWLVAEMAAVEGSVWAYHGHIPDGRHARETQLR